MQALNTTPGWQFTFFAPSNTAFNNTGQYFETYAKTAKGKWWLGNLIQHHYVPNTQLGLSKFSTESTRIQTGSFLYVGTQLSDDTLMLNNVSAVTEGDIEVTNVGAFYAVIEQLLTLPRAWFILLTTFSTLQLKFSNQIYPRRTKTLLQEAVQTPICHTAEG